MSASAIAAPASAPGAAGEPSEPSQPSDSQEFCLAAAVLEYPSPSDEANTQAPAPTAWQRQFWRTQSNGQLWLGLYATCRWGRDKVLKSAESATLTIDTSARDLATTLPTKVQAAVRGLRVRGPRPTALTLLADADGPEAKRHEMGMLAACAGLTGATDSIHELSIVCPPKWNRPAQAQTAQQADSGGDAAGDSQTQEGDAHSGAGGEADSGSPAQLPQIARVKCFTYAALLRPFTHLTTLSIHPLRHALPPPDHIPTLTTLNVTIDNAKRQIVRDTLPAYWQTVTHMELNVRGKKASQRVFGPMLAVLLPLGLMGTVGRTLTHLKTNQPLNEAQCYLGLLCAPALESLTVPSLQSVTAGLAGFGRVWGLKELCIEQGYVWTNEAHMLSQLPSTVGPLLINTQDVSFVVEDTQGLSEAVQQCLPNWQFPTGCTLHVLPHPDMSPADQCTALHSVTSQLRSHIEQQGALLWLDDWPLSPAVLAAINTITPTLPPRSVGLTLRSPLTGTTMAQVAQLTTPVCEVYVMNSVDLQSSEHADTVLRAALRADSVNMRQLLRLPRGCAGVGGDRLCVTFYDMVIDVTLEEVSSGLLDTLCARLQHYQFTDCHRSQVTITLTSQPHLTPQEQVTLLHHQLTLVRAMQWDKGCSATLKGHWCHDIDWETSTLPASESPLCVLSRWVTEWDQTEGRVGSGKPFFMYWGQTEDAEAGLAALSRDAGETGGAGETANTGAQSADTGAE